MNPALNVGKPQILNKRLAFKNKQDEEKPMGRVTFIEHDGTEHSAEIEEGKSLMQTALDNLVPGIDADCGGQCSCGTCHVMVSEDWIGRTGKATEDELQMLDLNEEKFDTSRLACQIPLSNDMDGMVVRLPEFQM